MSTTCTSPIGCDEKNISPEAAFKKLIAKDSNGCPALRTLVVDPAGETTCDEFITCDNREETWKSLFFKMIAETEDGCWALKVIQTS